MSSPRRPLAAERRRIARRATCLQAVWNHETMQGVGFAWAIAPGLDRLYPDPRARGERLLAHLEPFNSNPYLATIGIGFALRLEQEVARGSAGADYRLSRLIKALRSSLGALGDDLFWVAWRPTLGVIGAAVALATGSPIAALMYWIAYNALAQSVRWRGVRAGFASGAGIARVLQDPFWSRASGITKTAGAAASGAVLGGALWAASSGGLGGISVFFFITAFLWLAGLRRGSRGRWLSPSVAFLVVVILLSVVVRVSAGGLP
ncbi:MAG: PTS system mannose/fructose/sorbose family transporter subunit IID [Gemmatimonadetes bacterium]|nr:PTS system mannose/fructose/sorbose family transporter subunit IID [Gemmatimonadota bacterium]